LKKKGLATDKNGKSLAAAFVDESVFNLSSIVVLAEAGKKKMLLTWDARGDDVLNALKTSGMLKSGLIHVDLLKLPHHGSDRNVATEFFRAVTADHYVVSADGRFGNPEISTLQMISEARGKDKFTIHLTNREKRLDTFFASEKKKGKKYKVVYRDPKSLSLWIDLGDEALED
jgi:beta-lactamase superfamily II metal-dependent hydrolase